MKSIKPFLFGVIAALGALFLEVIFSLFFPDGFPDNYHSDLTFFLLLTVMSEEGLKSLFIYKAIENAQSLLHALAHSLLLGLGFSLTEIVLRLSKAETNLSLEMAGAFSIHLITAIIIGALIYSPMRPKIQRILLAFTLSFTLHLLYNLAVIYNY